MRPPEPVGLVTGDRVAGVCAHRSHDCYGREVEGRYCYETAPARHLITTDEGARVRGHIVVRVRLLEEGA